MRMNNFVKEQAIMAANALKEGKMILYPTDTVWGIGCDATSEEAVKRVFELKKRQDSKSLVILVSDMDMLSRYVRDIPPMAEQLIEVNDVPMTIIYPGALSLAPSAIAEDGSVAIRIPMNGFCVEMIRRFGKPIVSTSANISGEPTATTFEMISEAILNGVDYVVDSKCDIESTGRPSQIIKLGMDYEIEIIRK